MQKGNGCQEGPHHSIESSAQGMIRTKSSSGVRAEQLNSHFGLEVSLR